MAKISILCGVLLLGLAALGYFGTDGSPASTDVSSTESNASTDGTESSALSEAKPSKRSFTALIPAAFGIPLLLCGILALDERKLKHAMHIAAMFGLLGALAGGGRGMMGLGKFFSGDPSLNQRSFLYVWLMTLICGAFVVLCVRSFIAVRRQRQAEQASND